MNKTRIVSSVMLLLGVVNLSRAESTKSEESASHNNIWQRQTLADGFYGLGDNLSDTGIELGLSVTQIYQQNVHGGLSTHRRAGRYSGSYDLELTADLQRFLGIEGATVYVHAEGLWSKSGGIDGPSVGSVFGVNGDAGDRRSMDVTELWYEQSMFDGNFLLRLGKMDITGGFEHHGCPVAFDCSLFANDETTQFLNSALVNNPTIPFPDYALGIAGLYKPIERWYLSAAVVDAQNDARETGFRTTFGDEDYFFYVFETGITPQLNSSKGPLQGVYRVGIWNDPQPKAHSDSSKNYRDDVGFYLSCGQMLIKENAEPEDSQGLGAFFRYGYANDKRNDIADFWSVGFQYQGLIEGRDDDVLGAGFAQGFFSNKASTTYTEDYERAAELYYSARITPWFNLSPSIQYITNPGGTTTSDAVLLGVRTLITF